MCSMRSMRGGLLPVVKGPCKRYAMAGTYVRPQLPPGAADGLFPRGRPHEQNEEVPLMDGSASRTHTTRTTHTFSLTPRLLLLSADFAPHPPWVRHWAPVGAPPHRWRGFPLVVSTNRPWGRPVGDTRCAVPCVPLDVVAKEPQRTIHNRYERGGCYGGHANEESEMVSGVSVLVVMLTEI